MAARRPSAARLLVSNPLGLGATPTPPPARQNPLSGTAVATDRDGSDADAVEGSGAKRRVAAGWAPIAAICGLLLFVAGAAFLRRRAESARLQHAIPSSTSMNPTWNGAVEGVDFVIVENSTALYAVPLDEVPGRSREARNPAFDSVPVLQPGLAVDSGGYVVDDGIAAASQPRVYATIEEPQAGNTGSASLALDGDGYVVDGREATATVIYAVPVEDDGGVVMRSSNV